QAEDGIRDRNVTGVQTCALPISAARQYKLDRATETRSTCPYCSVACGILVYSMGDGAKNAKPSVMHIEGDHDHPVNRGTLCPKEIGRASCRVAVYSSVVDATEPM